MNWIRKAWRALVRASEPEAPRRVNVGEHPGAVLVALREKAEEEFDEDSLAEIMAARVEFDRRVLLRRAAALIATVGTFAGEGFSDVEIAAPVSVPPRWDSSASDPLADVMAARKKIEEATGLAPTMVLLGAGHRAYILAHFGLDVAKPETRAELSRELGMRVELAAPA